MTMKGIVCEVTTVESPEDDDGDVTLQVMSREIHRPRQAYDEYHYDD